MNGIPQYIKDKIDATNVDIDWKTIRKHSFQGFMSEVYTVNSKDGQIYILHKVFLLEEHKKGNLALTLNCLTTFFTKVSLPKTPRYIFIESKDGYLYSLQAYIEGKPSGKREIRNNKIRDVLDIINNTSYISELLIFLANLHEKPILGAGYIENLEKGILNGKYSTWKNYILHQINTWVEHCNLNNKELEIIGAILGTIPAESKNSLIHGDVMNPSNILVNNDEKIVGVIDWEWSIIGDAAWEFAGIGWEKIVYSESMNIYFENRDFSKVDRHLFVEKVKRYHIIWLLWGTYLHANDTDQTLYSVLRKYLIECIHKL